MTIAETKRKNNGNPRLVALDALANAIDMAKYWVRKDADSSRPDAHLHTIADDALLTMAKAMVDVAAMAGGFKGEPERYLKIAMDANESDEAA